jgi:hypothetical protein
VLLASNRTGAASPRRPFLPFGVAALIGLGIGVVWVIAGLLHFHVLR